MSAQHTSASVTQRLYPTSILAAVSGATVPDIAMRRKNELWRGGKPRGNGYMYYSLAEIVNFSCQQDLVKHGVFAEHARRMGNQVQKEAMDSFTEQTVGTNESACFVLLRTYRKTDQKAEIHVLRSADDLLRYSRHLYQPANMIRVDTFALGIASKLAEHLLDEYELILDITKLHR